MCISQGKNFLKTLTERRQFVTHIRKFFSLHDAPEGIRLILRLHGRTDMALEFIQLPIGHCRSMFWQLPLMGRNRAFGLHWSHRLPGHSRIFLIELHENIKR